MLCHDFSRPSTPFSYKNYWGLVPCAYVLIQNFASKSTKMLNWHFDKLETSSKPMCSGPKAFSEARIPFQLSFKPTHVFLRRNFVKLWTLARSRSDLQNSGIFDQEDIVVKINCRHFSLDSIKFTGATRYLVYSKRLPLRIFSLFCELALY